VRGIPRVPRGYTRLRLVAARVAAIIQTGIQSPFCEVPTLLRNGRSPRDPGWNTRAAHGYRPVLESQYESLQLGYSAGRSVRLDLGPALQCFHEGRNLKQRNPLAVVAHLDDRDADLPDDLAVSGLRVAG
jgi:hypothetical protein